MTKKSDAPAIRFKGFSDAWEQRKFGEITSKYEDPVPTPHDGYYRLGIRSHAKGTFHSYVAKGQELETAQMHRVAAGNFIVNITFGWEHAVAITDKNDAGKLVSHRFPQFSFAEGMVPEFFRYVIVDEKFRHHLWLASPGGAGRNRVLKLDEMLNYLMRFPSRDEQIKIAEFFRHLDNLITLHQRECISFTGRADRLILTANKKRTTSSWEQRKLGDISEIKTGPFGSTLHADDYVSDGTPIITTEHFKTGALPRSKNGLPQVSDSDYKRLTAYTLDDGDIVFSRVGSVDINALITPFQSNWLFSGRVLRVRPQTDISSKFLHTRLETESIKTDIRTRAVGQTMPSINTEILKITPLVLPSSAAEQEQIGSYFAALDNLITLHQRKCANLCSPSQVVFSLLFATSTFSWEQRKFEEIAVRSSVICSDDTLPRVEYEDIVSGTGRLNKDIYAKQSIKSGIAFHQGDVLYGKLRPYLQNWLLPTFDGLAVGDFWVLQPQNADSSFLYRLIQSRQFDEVANQSTGTKMPRADWKLVSKTVFSIPSNISEQAAIGTYFTALDSLITLHQRKFEKLTNVKKSMLEKIFPQNGSSYPEIRFKGFTDPWEQRKLSEITDKVTEKNAGLQYVETFTNSAEFGIISQRDFFDHDIAKLGSLDGYYIVKNEDFVYNPRISTSAPVGPINRNKLGRTGVMSPLYTVFRPHDIDTTYLEYFFKCGYWHSFMNFNGDSGARSDRFSIRDNVFFQMPIPIPDIDEQRKIGELLTCLDNLITLHQRELEKLQNIKKSMLEKMFV